MHACGVKDSSRRYEIYSWCFEFCLPNAGQKSRYNLIYILVSSIPINSFALHRDRNTPHIMSKLDFYWDLCVRSHVIMMTAAVQTFYATALRCHLMTHVQVRRIVSFRIITWPTYALMAFKSNHTFNPIKWIQTNVNGGLIGFLFYSHQKIWIWWIRWSININNFVHTFKVSRAFGTITRALSGERIDRCWTTFLLFQSLRFQRNQFTERNLIFILVKNRHSTASSTAPSRVSTRTTSYDSR